MRNIASLAAAIIPSLPAIIPSLPNIPQPTPRTIFDMKRSRIYWGWAGRVKPSRYDGAMLRMIRKHGQARECARRRRAAPTA
jgi:hypothetical protein